MLESLLRRGMVHTASPCIRFAGCEAAEHRFGHFCRGRTYRIWSKRISTPYFCVSQPRGMGCAMSLVCSVCRVSDAYRDPQVCAPRVAKPLPSGWVVLAACAEQFCHGGCLGPAPALVVSAVSGHLLTVRKSVPPVLGTSNFTAQVLQDCSVYRFQPAHTIICLGLREIRHLSWICCSACAA